jgi:hypothetical protein
MTFWRQRDTLARQVGDAPMPVTDQVLTRTKELSRDAVPGRICVGMESKDVFAVIQLVPRNKHHTCLQTWMIYRRMQHLRQVETGVHDFE